MSATPLDGWGSTDIDKVLAEIGGRLADRFTRVGIRDDIDARVRALIDDLTTSGATQ